MENFGGDLELKRLDLEWPSQLSQLNSRWLLDLVVNKCCVVHVYKDVALNRSISMARLFQLFLHAVTYNTIQYKTSNMPYVTRKLFVGADRY